MIPKKKYKLNSHQLKRENPVLKDRFPAKITNLNLPHKLKTRNHQFNETYQPKRRNNSKTNTSKEISTSKN